MSISKINISFKIVNNIISDIKIIYNRIPAEKLFVGMTAFEVYKLIPNLYTICKYAHQYAARAAFNSCGIGFNDSENNNKLSFFSYKKEIAIESIWWLIEQSKKILNEKSLENIYINTYKCLADKNNNIKKIKTIKKYLKQEFFGEFRKVYELESYSELINLLNSENKKNKKSSVFLRAIQQVVSLGNTNDIKVDYINYQQMNKENVNKHSTNIVDEFLSNPLIHELINSQDINKFVIANYLSHGFSVNNFFNNLNYSKKTLLTHNLDKNTNEYVFGFANTSRGKLMHLVKSQENKLLDYKIIAPTDINFLSDGIINEIKNQNVNDVINFQENINNWIAALNPCVPYKINYVN